MMFKKRNLRKITPDQKAELLGSPEKQAEIVQMKNLEEKNAKNPASLTSTEIKTLMEYRQRVRDGKAAGLTPSAKQLFALHPGRNESTFPKVPKERKRKEIAQIQSAQKPMIQDNEQDKRLIGYGTLDKFQSFDPEVQSFVIEIGSVDHVVNLKLRNRSASADVKDDIQAVSVEPQANVQKQSDKDQRRAAKERKKIIQMVLPDHGRGRYSALERMKIAKAFTEAGYVDDAAQMLPPKSKTDEMLSVEVVAAKARIGKLSAEELEQKKKILFAFTLDDIVREFDPTVNIPVVPADDHPGSPRSQNTLDMTQKPDLADEKIPKNTLFATIRHVPASKCVDLGSGPL